MTSSTSSKTGRVPDRTPKGKSKGGNRARARPVEKVRNGRVKKRQHNTSSSRVGSPEIPESTDDVQKNSRYEPPPQEIISSGEDHDDYEEAGTDKDCSEASGSATEKDTPTRAALERRKEAKKASRAKITSHRLGSSKDSFRTAPDTPSTQIASSIGRSSPCVRRIQAVERRHSPSARPRSSPPTDDRLHQTAEEPESESDSATAGTNGERVRGRGCMVAGEERIVLDVARDDLLDFTLFGNPFPSAQELTSLIHHAWRNSENFHEVRVDASGESLEQVSRGKTLNIQSGTLNVI